MGVWKFFFYVVKFLSWYIFTLASELEVPCSILYIKHAFHPDMLFGSTERWWCVQYLCPAQERGRSSSVVPGVSRRGNMGNPFPCHILNGSFVFGWYLILYLVRMCEVLSLSTLEKKRAQLHLLQSESISSWQSSLILSPWSFWVGLGFSS